MTWQCRTCGNVIYNMNAKNLFESENSEILINIKFVVGTALVCSPELPSHICACCLLDLKQAVFHMKIFRERCIKTQEQLSSHNRTDELSSDGDSEFNISEDSIKQEIDINYEDLSTKRDKLEDDDEDDFMEFEPEKNISSAVVGNCDEEDADSLIASVQNEMRSNCEYSSDSQEGTDELQALSESDCSRNSDNFKNTTSRRSKRSNYTNVLIKTRNKTTANRKTSKQKLSSKCILDNVSSSTSHKVKKTYISWKNLTEEQIIDRRREQRRRDCICDQCGRHFTDQSNFKLHMLRHTGVKNFKCKECGKLFYTEHLLQLHERTVHRGERPYACKFCDKSFNSSTTRVMHERSHTNVRPYSCEYCDKTFISTSALKRHDLTHNGVRPFYCTTCDKTFQRNTHLKAHLRSKLHALRESSISLLNEFE